MFTFQLEIATSILNMSQYLLGLPLNETVEGTGYDSQSAFVTKVARLGN